MDYLSMSDKAILAELGERMRRHRLNQNITQMDLARQAGVARSVVQKFEQGQDCMLGGIIRMFRILGVLDQLDAFLPDPGPSPIQLARFQGRQRKRATRKKQ